MRQQTKQIRRAAAMVACLELLSIIINYALVPVMSQIPEFPAGSAANELYEIVLYVLIFGVPVLVGMRWSGLTLGDLCGGGRPPVRIYLLTAAVTAGWSYAAGWLAGLMELGLNSIGLTEPNSTYVVPTSTAALLLQILSIAIIPPLVEELCYRGLYLRLMTPGMGAWGAIMLTALVFWMAHYRIEVLPLAFGFGIIGGYVRTRYGSLLPSMLAHFVVNGTYVLVNYTWERFDGPVSALVNGAVSMVELVLGVLSFVLLGRIGWSRLRDALPAPQGDLEPDEMARAAVCSIPVIVLLLSVVYFTARGLGVYHGA